MGILAGNALLDPYGNNPIPDPASAPRRSWQPLSPSCRPSRVLCF